MELQKCWLVERLVKVVVVGGGEGAELGGGDKPVQPKGRSGSTSTAGSSIPVFVWAA